MLNKSKVLPVFLFDFKRKTSVNSRTRLHMVTLVTRAAVPRMTFIGKV